jgi:sorbitol-specific phosphotransferase system component IIBC
MFFRRHADGESQLRTTVLPVIAFVAFVIIIYMIVVNFGSLSGASGFLGAFLPGLVLIAAIVGIVMANALKGSNPKAFARLGETLND